jgi:hypothetical protein
MTDAEDQDDESVVVDFVDDAIGSDADSPEVLVAGHFDHACGSGVVGQQFNGPDDAFLNIDREAAQLPIGRWLERDGISLSGQGSLHPQAGLDVVQRDAAFFLPSLQGSPKVFPLLHHLEQGEVFHGDQRGHAFSPPLQHNPFATVGDPVERVGEVVPNFSDSDVHDAASPGKIAIMSFMYIIATNASTAKSAATGFASGRVRRD